MAREKREWHPNFIKYMEFIINHPAYNGLPFRRNHGINKGLKNM